MAETGVLEPAEVMTPGGEGAGTTLGRAGAVYQSLDLMNSTADRYRLAAAVRNGWNIDPEVKRTGFACVKKILDAELLKEKPNSRIVRSCMKVIQAEESAALKDLHHQERLDGIRMAAAAAPPPAPGVQVNVQINNGVPGRPAIDYDAFRRQYVADVVKPGAK